MTTATLFNGSYSPATGRNPRPPTSPGARYRMSEIDNLLERSSVNFPDHREALAHIAPRRTDDSLQIYLW